MSRERQLEEKVGELCNELAKVTNENDVRFEILERKLDKSQQQVRLLKAVLGILEEDMDLKTEHAALYINLSRNPLWLDLDNDEAEKESSNEEDVESSPISVSGSDEKKRKILEYVLRPS